MSENQYYAVIEAGGTKFNCAIVDANRTIYAQTRINTSTPDETIAQTIDFFKQQMLAGYVFKQLGLACFGPLDLAKKSKTYGCITATPKLHWSNTPIVTMLEQALKCKVYLDTDVNAAALAEYRWGAAQGTSVSIYITVGTGVGGGVVINGFPVHGLVHPEIGHMLVPPPEGIQGVCPFHGNCVEGLASGAAMGRIWKKAAETLPDEHRAWDIQAQVLARLCHNLIIGYSAEKIVLGGGVMAKPNLLDKVIAYTQTSLADYVTFPQGSSLHSIICLPSLGQHSGLFGALALILNV
ncbi:ROK family protein [Paraglaciecola sp.]|uniref:ROK family protein n=1 Tax=Paraglaciecola sp. TaxID=1920173 RepID=UPI0030F416B2